MKGAKDRGWKKAVTAELQKIEGMEEVEVSRARGWAIRREDVVEEWER